MRKTVHHDTVRSGQGGRDQVRLRGGNRPGDLRHRVQFPTTTPVETLGRVVEYFRQQAPLTAIGVACFGPVDVDPTSATFGHITTTPKEGWRQANVVGALRAALQVPVGFDTDVNGAALGERTWGAGRGLRTFLYLTIGTGIGGGGMVEGRLMHGLIHPEMGHMRVPRSPGDSFEGTCPFHKDCWEGLASGPAIEARSKKPAQELAPEDPAWELEARYLALGVANLVCTLSPERIILGGGVMHHAGLIGRVRKGVQGLLNEYIQAAALREEIEQYIVLPALGDDAGILGAIALAWATAG